jgi:hypothetical protein
MLKQIKPWPEGTGRDALSEADRVLAKLRKRYPDPKPWRLPGQCALARKQQGAETRAKIIHLWGISRLPERERATSIATRLGLSERHVRRVLKK